MMRFLRYGLVALALSLVAAACGDDSGGAGSTSSTDAVSAAQARVSTAQTNVTNAQGALTSANQKFCSDAKDYVVAIDKYGKLFTDKKTTVGDIKLGAVDLVAPRDTVVSSANAVNTAQANLSSAQGELVAAQAALTDAQAGAAGAPTNASTAPAATTTTTIVPPATIDLVKQAESDFAKASTGISDSTPLTQAAVEYNSAAFELEIAWLKVLSDAGCLTDEQQAKAAAQVTEYTVALQTELRAGGYYTGEVDGIYGPLTVAAVKEVQTEAGLPVTGVVDQATALAMDKKAADEAVVSTTALQTLLKILGFWDGPIDGKWTPELTDALKAFQTALGVEPTGVVDALTLAAFEQALEQAQGAVSSTTTSAPATTAAGETTTTVLTPTPLST